MTLLAAEKISKKFKDQVILDSVSFTIEEGARIALVGKNGIGKTTLLELLDGKQETDSGVLTRARSCRIDYVEQEKTEYLDFTLLDFVADARRDLVEAHDRLRSLEHHLELHPHDKEKLDELGRCQHIFEKDGGFDFENEIKIILTGLGFAEDRYADRLKNFSGGEKNRAGLARVLAGRGNLLLLDEPTNHLDIESTTWLEEYLKKMNKACLIVSHDRAFMSAVAQLVWELSYSKIDVYVGSFEKYMGERIDRRVQAAHSYRLQQGEIKRAEEFIRRNMAGQKTKQAQSRLKSLNKIKRLPPPPKDGRGPMLKLESSGRSYAQVLRVDDLSLGYGDRTVVKDASFEIFRGDKVGLIGRNGSGKSTLLRALIGELEPSRGSINLGNNVEVAYFDQELADLNLELSVLDNFWEVDPSAEVGPMRSYLGRFGFTGEDAHKMVLTLSGGEKTKLSLAKLLYKPANFVILDEPTNHLDIFAREALEDALREYDGSCLIVSHDRYFLNRVTDKIVYVNEGRVKVFNGNYEYFKEKTALAQPSPVKSKSTSSGQEFRSFKEESKRKAKYKKQVDTTKADIAKYEAELSQLDYDLHHNIPASQWEKLITAGERKLKVENLILELYGKLEQLTEETKDDNVAD